MNERQIRETIIEGLEAGNNQFIKNKEVYQSILEGSEDIILNSLELDSLGVMEFCITIELNTGVSIVPEQLQTFGTLNALILEIRSQTL